MPEPTKLLIIGAGGLAREVAGLLEPSVTRGEIDLIGFVEPPNGSRLECCVNGYPCREMGEFTSIHKQLTAVIAVGTSDIREEIASDLDRLGIPLKTCVHDSIDLSRTVRIGAGSVILGGSTITTDVSLGRSVVVNPGCTISHDAVIEDFVTISPGVHIAGNVRIRRGAFIGVGASISNGTSERKLLIGEHAVVGAGACVIGDVSDGATVVGVPARRIS